MSGLSQPPRSSSAAGKSQWKSVAQGAMPCASKRVDEPVVIVEALCVHRCRVPSGSTRLHEMLNRYAFMPSSLISATSSA